VEVHEVGQKTRFKQERFRLCIKRNVFPMRTVGRWLRLPKRSLVLGGFQDTPSLSLWEPHWQHQLGPETSTGPGQPASLRLQV